MIKAFLKEQRHVLILFCLLSGIMLLTFYLYDLPLGALFDAVLFAGFLLLLYLVYCGYRWLPRQKQMQELARQKSLADPTILPTAENLSEEYYQQLLQTTNTLLKEEKSRNQKQKQAIMDDFGLWLHQIKTPVAALDLLSQTSDPDPIALKLEVFKVNEYLQMMLNYLRQNLDDADFVFTKVQLEPLVKKMIRKYALFFSRQNISLELERLDQTVVTDEKWLAFILDQLFSNAVKYTKNGTTRITGDHESLSVEDSGVGIRKEDLPRIFEKGYTGYNGRLEKRASGLGLYLAKTAADKIGVEIHLASEVGKGTSVTLTFPQELTFHD